MFGRFPCKKVSMVDKVDRTAASNGNDKPDPAPELEQGLVFAAFRLRRMAIVFSDPNQPDNPIVYCNPAFVEQTG